MPQVIRIIMSAAILVSVGAGGARADAGDPVRGAQRFQAVCGACHSADPAVKRLSVHLKSIIGRKAASVPGVAYSTALKASGWIWTKEQLETYLADPKKALPGTTMMVAAANAKDRADIIAYLASLN